MAALTQTCSSSRAQHVPPGPQQKQAPSRWPARRQSQGRAAAGRWPGRSVGRQDRRQPAPPLPRPCAQGLERTALKEKEANPQIPTAGFCTSAGPGVPEASGAAHPLPMRRMRFALLRGWGDVSTDHVNNQSREGTAVAPDTAHFTDRGRVWGRRGALTGRPSARGRAACRGGTSPGRLARPGPPDARVLGNKPRGRVTGLGRPCQEEEGGDSRTRWGGRTQHPTLGQLAKVLGEGGRPDGPPSPPCRSWPRRLQGCGATGPH